MPVTSTPAPAVAGGRGRLRALWTALSQLSALCHHCKALADCSRRATRDAPTCRGRREQQYWSRSRGRTGGLLHAALGDSAAQGPSASRPDQGYVGVLARRLEAATARPVEVVDLSRSGARLADVLHTQLPALAALGRTPHVVTVAIGGNDIVPDDRALFAEQADRLADAPPDGAYVADAPYFTHGRFDRDSRDAADLLATATDFAADWSHPNDRGHRVWADALWDRMITDLGVTRRTGARTSGRRRR